MGYNEYREGEDETAWSQRVGRGYDYTVDYPIRYVNTADGWRLDVAADLGHSPKYNHCFVIEHTVYDDLHSARVNFFDERGEIFVGFFKVITGYCAGNVLWRKTSTTTRAGIQSAYANGISFPTSWTCAVSTAVIYRA